MSETPEKAVSDIDPSMLCITCKKREVRHIDDDWCAHCSAEMDKFRDLMNQPPPANAPLIAAVKLDRFHWHGEGTLIEATLPLLRALHDIDGRLQGGATAQDLTGLTRGVFLVDGDPTGDKEFDKVLTKRVEAAMRKLVLAGLALELTTGSKDTAWALSSAGWAIIESDFE